MLILSKSRYKLETQKVTIYILFLIWVIACAYLLKDLGIKVHTFTQLFCISIQLFSAVKDILSKCISGKLMLLALLFGSAWFVILFNLSLLLIHLLVGVIVFVSMRVLIIVSKGQLGEGDMLLLAVTGFLLGFVLFLKTLFISTILAGGYSIILIIIKRGNRNTEIPFAPFIYIATVACCTFI